MKLKKPSDKKFKDIVITLVVFGGSLVALLILFDVVIMPLYTEQGNETQIPNVINLSLQAAETRLSEADLSAVEGGEEYDPTRPKGVVINQVPEAGSVVKKGRKVTITLSKGSASAIVPRLEGYTLREARMLLGKEGLQPGSIIWFTDETLPDGVVITSMPPPGTVMKLNAGVQLMVNRVESNMLVKVPKFIGMDLAQARILAEDNYLLIGDLNYSFDAKLLPETVIAQSAAFGQLVPKWTAINLTVSASE